MLEGIKQEILDLSPEETNILYDRWENAKYNKGWKAERMLQNADELELLQVVYCEVFKDIFPFCIKEDSKAFKSSFFRYASLDDSSLENISGNN
jgi:hypothetical protein